MAQASTIPQGILGKSPQIEGLRAQIQRLAAFDAPGNPRVPTVLLQGETGSGKGLVAQAMHDCGPRSAGPFVDVNCAAIPDAMLEAELFGFEAGAFTDAKKPKPGLFEAASGGTLFLDEIDSVAPQVQSKLLKAIEEKRIRRLGAVSAHDVDVKLVAATQRDLKVLAATGSFRADLYHRLAVLILVIPPLRDRDDDAVVIGTHFLAAYAAAHGLAPKCLTDDGRQWLSRHRWPGNVRELSHLMERVTLLADRDEIDGAALERLCPEPISAATHPTGTPAPPNPEPQDDEGARIRAALTRTGGNVLRAARLLGLGRNALRYRMRRLGLTRAALEPSPMSAEPVGNESDSPQRPTIAAEPEHPRTDIAAQTAWEPKPISALVLTFELPEPNEGDFEPWTTALRWERSICDRIEGFGGTLLQRSPARLTAVFGVPRSLEQTPQRAVQAALAIQHAASHSKSPRPKICAAVHLGQAHVDPRATLQTGGLLPIGDTLALPERLLGHTSPGEVLVSSQVARRIERAYDLEARSSSLGPGDADQIETFRVLGPWASSGSPPLDDDAATNFVGRERELEVLAEAFGQVREGHGQIVFVAGEAGIGKSRMLSEFRRRLDAQPHRWSEGHCASYGTVTPFLPVIDCLHHFFGIDDRDDEASASAKIASEVERLGNDLDWTQPFVKQVLSLWVGDTSVSGLDSASRRSEIFRALRALTLRTAELAPLVLVIEDLHWTDTASEEFLAFVADVIPASRVLLILSHRPGYKHPFGDRSYHQRITLAPLSGTHTAAMTNSILGTPDVPDELRSLIANKAEGNPFYVEELAKSLLEDGSLVRRNGRVVLARDLAHIVIPNTIQDVIVARIDRLAEPSKRAIQVASVIGREFALRLLARITDAGEQIRTQVDELRGLELIYEKPMDPELAYMFKHALTHDVAYESLLADRRRALHRTIGLAIEALYADRLAEHHETLAHHFTRGEDWERALTYHQRSAEKAAGNYANRAVVEHCRRALEIADRIGDTVPDEVRLRLGQLLGVACSYLSDFLASGQAYERAAIHASETEGRAVLLSVAANSFFWGHDYEACNRCLDETEDLARRHNCPAAEAQALAVRGFGLGVLDADLVGFRGLTQKALDILVRHPHPGVEAFALHNLVLAAEWSGAFVETIQRAERVIAIGRQLQRPELVILPTWFLAKARCCIGDYGGTITLLNQAYELCERIGDRAWRSRLLNTLGWCFSEIGSTQRARDYNLRAAELSREIGDPEILSNAAINLAVNHIALGELDRAEDDLGPIEATIAEPGDPWMRWRYSVHVQDTRSRLELARGEPERALAATKAALEAARKHGTAKLEARSLVLGATILHELERQDEARRLAMQALSVADRIEYLRVRWQVPRLLAQMERRAGNGPEAAAQLARCRHLAEEAARSLPDRGLRRDLLAVAIDEPSR